MRRGNQQVRLLLVAEEIRAIIASRLGFSHCGVSNGRMFLLYSGSDPLLYVPHNIMCLYRSRLQLSMIIHLSPTFDWSMANTGLCHFLTGIYFSLLLKLRRWREIVICNWSEPWAVGMQSLEMSTQQRNKWKRHICFISIPSRTF